MKKKMTPLEIVYEAQRVMDIVEVEGFPIESITCSSEDEIIDGVQKNLFKDLIIKTLNRMVKAKNIKEKLALIYVSHIFEDLNFTELSVEYACSPQYIRQVVKSVENKLLRLLKKG